MAKKKLYNKNELFKKGGKGGPGRPKGSGAVPRCADWAQRYGFNFLERIAEGKEKDINGFGKTVPAGLSIRKSAAEYLIDRGYGKAKPEDREEESAREIIVKVVKYG